MLQVSESRQAVRLPNFFLVGAPKAGTTSLYHYLDQHPQIYMSPIKEPHYLAEEIRFENFGDQMQRMAAPRLPALREYLQGPVSATFSGGPVSEWPDYVKLFQGARGETAIGEASVCYLWSKTAPHNIKARFPDAKILIILRDPAERAFSQYLHMLSFAESPISFREHIAAALMSKSTRISELYPFLEFGRYSEQLDRYFQVFPREQILIRFYDDYEQDPVAMMQEVFRFLSVESSFVPDLSQRHMQARVPRSYLLNRSLKQGGLWGKAREWSPPAVRRALKRLLFRPRSSFVLAAADRARLVDLYREDIRCVSKLLDRDLNSWLSA